MKLQSFITLLIGAILITACATSTKTGASGVARKQFLMLPSSQVNKMSAQSYTATLKDAQNKKILNTDPKVLERVRTISNRLIAQTHIFREDASKWAWEVNVEQNDQVNAYCMPGGKIMVLTGLIDKLNATDDELAAVIGHEIAHALREHGRERMSQAYVQQFGLQALAAYIGGGAAGNAVMQGASLGSNLFFALPNGREQERESDRIGLELAARAGYNPNAAVTLWQKMDGLGGSKPPEFFSTHPSSKNRIKDLNAMIPDMMPLYTAAQKQ